MKDKVVVFSETTPFFIKKMLLGVLPHLSKKNEVYYYSSSLFSNKPKYKVKTILDKKLEYFYGSKDFRIYKGVLDYCQKIKAHTLFIPRLYQPEILLSELKSRNYCPQIVTSIFGLQDVANSKARCSTYLELLDHKFFHRLFIYSIAGIDLELPSSFKNKTKITKLFDPIYEEPKNYQIEKSKARKYLGLNANLYYVLYFGLMVYGKGIDILYNATRLLKDDKIKVLIASDPNTINFDFSDTVFNNTRNIEYRSGSVSEKDMFYYFSASDAVVMPYRRTYQYGTSGVLVQSVLANRPIICPDIYPFQDVCEKYGIGTVFKSENSRSLANSIVKTKNKSLALQKKILLNKYLSNIQTWDYVADKISHQK